VELDATFDARWPPYIARLVTRVFADLYLQRYAEWADVCTELGQMPKVEFVASWTAKPEGLA
jgi:hypothetical protein